MKRAIIPTVILCTAICIGLHTQPNRAVEIIPTPEPPQVEVTATPIPTPKVEIEEPIVEVIMPEPTPYVPGFGWIESQGEGTVTYDENIYENGNKVGIMG